MKWSHMLDLEADMHGAEFFAGKAALTHALIAKGLKVARFDVKYSSDINGASARSMDLVASSGFLWGA